MKKIYLSLLSFCLPLCGIVAQDLTFDFKDPVIVEFLATPFERKFTATMPIPQDIVAAIQLKDKEGNKIGKLWTISSKNSNKEIAVISDNGINKLENSFLEFKISNDNATIVSFEFNNEGKPLLVKVKQSQAAKFFDLQLKSVIDEDVQNGKKTDDEKSQEPVKSFINFIPPTISIGDLMATPCTSCLNDYKVTYDFSGGAEAKICYFKKVICDCKQERNKGEKNPQPDTNAKNVKQIDCCKDPETYCYQPVKKIRPQVGKNIGLHILGYYPYYDTIGLSFNFDSKNLEQRDAFASSFAQPKPTDSKEKSKDGVAKAASKNLEDLNQAIGTMASQYKDYYLYLARKAPELSIVKLDIEFINQQLSKYLNDSIEQYSPKGLTAAVQKRISPFLALAKNDNTIAKIVKELQDKLTEAANYYGYIIGYSSIKVPVVQMKNEDQFLWTMDFYRNKKKVDTREYSMMISGGWKIDFSSGFALNSLVDNKYSIQYGLAGSGINNKIDSARIIRQNEGNWLADIALMAHAYPRTGTRFNAGLTSGVVLRNGTNVKYLLGGSLMFGYEQRFILSGGCIMGYIDVLDQTYDRALNTYVVKSVLTAVSSSVPTTREFKFGTFFSLSYNLGGTTIGAKQKN
jgi:hypothetical protein